MKDLVLACNFISILKRYLSGNSDVLFLERFSNECHKIKTKVITLTNHNGNKTQNKPIISRGECK